MSSIAVHRGLRLAPPSRRRPVPAPVHLTRRGRLVVLAGFLVLAFTVLSLVTGGSAATRAPGAPVVTRTIVVAEGDTLWGIASTLAPPGRVREVIHQIEELNALPTAGLVEGQEIAVPRE